LTDRLAQMNAKQETIARDLERYQTLQSQLEAVRQTWQHRQTEHMQTVNAVKDVERTIQMDNERRAHAQSEHAAGNAHLEDTLVSLQSFFPDDLWIANWKSQPDAYLKSIDAFADEWKQTTEALERDRNARNVLRATLAGLQAEEQSPAADIVQAESELTDKQA